MCPGPSRLALSPLLPTIAAMPGPELDRLRALPGGGSFQAWSGSRESIENLPDRMNLLQYGCDTRHYG